MSLGKMIVGSLVTAAGLWGSPAVAQTEEPRPNVILIMADDVGAEVLGSYGSTTYTTPQLDKLAARGARFENAYATPLCTPSRVMLMTGQYPNRTGFTNLIAKKKTARMPSGLKTFADYFGEAGYKSAVVGKWQLGRLDQFADQPREHGFDEYCLWDWMLKNRKTSRYYKPSIRCNGSTVETTKEDYGPDIFLQFAVDFIEKNRDGPFLLYFPMTLPHQPLTRPPALREEARQNYPPGIDKNTAKFGHMVTYMDMMVGKIVQAVDDAGIADNTLIIFTADNGSPSEVRSRLGNFVVTGGKGLKNEAGTRVPFIASWPGHVPAGVRTQLLSLADVLPTIAQAAHIPVTDEAVDGMDFSHVLFNTPGVDRDHIFFSFKNDFWIRDKTYRFHKDGTLGYCPVTSDRKRYGFGVKKLPDYAAAKARMRALLDTYTQIVPMEGSDESVRGKKKRGKHRATRITLRKADALVAPAEP